MDLQALHERSLPRIESGGATLQGNLFQRLSPFHFVQTFLQFDLACSDLFLRSLLFELRDEDSVVELANLESNLILGLICLRPRALDISRRSAIGFANFKHLRHRLCETGAARVVGGQALIKKESLARNRSGIRMIAKRSRWDLDPCQFSDVCEL